MNTYPSPGSCAKKKGFVYVSNLAMITYINPRFSTEIEPYRFHTSGSKVYYVNGRKKIFLLNSSPEEEIYCGASSGVFKRPSGELLLFTPISPLEYLFS